MTILKIGDLIKERLDIFTEFGIVIEVIERNFVRIVWFYVETSEHRGFTVINEYAMKEVKLISGVQRDRI